MNMKKYICAAAVLFSMCCSPFVTYAQKSPEEKLNMTMYAIMNMYVDTVDKVSFVDDVIARTMRSLDPFSAYLTPEEAMANEAALLGPTSFGGGEFAQQNQETGSQHFPVQMQKTVQTAYMADDRTGYIRLTMFAEQTLDEFREAVAALGKQGMKNLILDLQGNPGGFFESAVAVADEFLDGDKTIVTTSGAHVPTQTATCQTDGCFETGRVVLLVNGQTMSAAEILTGALRDWDRAVLVGSCTYGKGLIQETLPFEDGSAIRLTVAKYLTPAGMSIQKPYEGYGKFFADTSVTYRSLVNGRLLKSQGGVAADVEVPRDTSFMTALYYNLTFNGFQQKEAASYMEKHHDALLKKYKTPERFFDNFSGEEDMFAELMNNAENAGIAYSQDEYDRTAPAVKTQLKALLGRALYPECGYIYYKILNTANPAVIKALEIIGSDGYDKILR